MNKKVLHYKYTCKLTGKTALAPYWTTGFPGNFVGCKVIDRTNEPEPCKSCDIETNREEAGFFDA